MTHRWIAERLRMGTASHLTHLLGETKEDGGKIKSKLPRTDPFNRPLATLSKTLPPQFGQNYDAKKVRNTYGVKGQGEKKKEEC